MVLVLELNEEKPWRKLAEAGEDGAGVFCCCWRSKKDDDRLTGPETGADTEPAAERVGDEADVEAVSCICREAGSGGVFAMEEGVIMCEAAVCLPWW